MSAIGVAAENCTLRKISYAESRSCAVPSAMPAAPWQKTKVVMLTFLSTEAAAVGCVNWVLAFVAVLSLAPGALLCCPWRVSAAAATNAMSSETQQVDLTLSTW